MSSVRTEGLEEHLHSLSPGEQAVGLAAFRLILDGTAASIDVIADRAGLPRDDVESIVSQLAQRGLIVVDSSGDVVGSWGLSLLPMVHRLRIAGRDLYTWCAEDAIGIPAALDEDATISSRCFQCGEPLTIEICAGHDARASAPNVRIWLVEAEIGRSIVGCT
ncbi:MAG: hypothetical protein EPO21_15005 [Chloroflexota bacterium]|nr:MAG: hypothetical protein EPO21_15005 [Chloroflexota bacterium]